MSAWKQLLDWLADKPQCQHHWRVLLEHYPSYAYDLWKCDNCGRTRECTEDEAPVKVKTGICSLGHVHIVN